MFKKIIWGTDGSENADHALGLAKELAAQNGSVLLAVHSIVELAGPGSRGAFPEYADEDEREVKIAKQVAELNEQGIDAEVKIVESGIVGAAHTLAKVAGEEGADLIVVGTRGQTPLAGLLLGSVTQRLLHLAPCPVLAVPPA
jgi:nucleotide-binding universal stress UspA family protein